MHITLCSYIQQLREGVHNFFVTFIEVLRDRPPGHDWELEPGVTCGDYLFGMLQVRFTKRHPNLTIYYYLAMLSSIVLTSQKTLIFLALVNCSRHVQGTRSALYANDRESISVTVQEVTPRSVGAMVALYERAVGLYASVININAYHQPGKYNISLV